MLWNIWKTVKAGRGHEEAASAPMLPKLSVSEMLKDRPHRMVEGLPAVFTVLTTIALLVGTIIEIMPTLTMDEFVEKDTRVKPYRALELAGRDIYMREGCYTCHSQQIRPMISEKLRYGEPSTLAESQYDRPFQWGSKRTGPDLARVGGKYPDLWHFRHMKNPRDVVPQSIMPSYPWLLELNTDYGSLERKLEVMRSLGVPYSEAEVKNAAREARAHARAIATAMVRDGVTPEMADKEIVAIIAYLQRLGKHESPYSEATEGARR